MKHVFFVTLIFVLCSFSVAQAEQSSFKIFTETFAPGGSIPALYTCDDANTSPPFVWGDVPGGTMSLAMIMEDPDAKGTWVHWVAYNIPPEPPQLIAPLPEGSIRQGKNSFGKMGYGGPCPPKGKGPHRYFFRLYALDIMLGLPPETTNSAALKAAMKGHILATTEFVGRYGR